MKIVMFYHSLVSDWNHGNAHFLRGIAAALQRRGHTVKIYEPENGWSYRNMLQDGGTAAAQEFRRRFPTLRSEFYNSQTLNLEAALDGANLVLVHEWNEPELIGRIGQHHKLQDDYILFFHDTHHRAASSPKQMEDLDLSGYDGALVFGEVIKNTYEQKGWVENVFTWHEAADTTVFKPKENAERSGDLVWIGNWGDEERNAELQEFLFEPALSLRLKTCIHGVRYPEKVKEMLAGSKIEYGGWLPNYRVPELFSRYRFTVHVPRRIYRTTLPGVPTIRPFEAMACGIPLISSPWQDSEGLFTPGKDYLTAADGTEMKKQMRMLLNEPDFASELAVHARETILARHTCEHRIAELFSIYHSLKNTPPGTETGILTEMESGMKTEKGDC
ncbi:MAG: glycosyltransferase [Calditrichia bacterium]